MASKLKYVRFKDGDVYTSDDFTFEQILATKPKVEPVSAGEVMLGESFFTIVTKGAGEVGLHWLSSDVVFLRDTFERKHIAKEDL